MKSLSIKLMLFTVTLCLFVTGCTSSTSTKSIWNDNSKGDIEIGVVGSESYMADTLYMDGVNMAVKEINEKGGFKGRLLKINQEDDDSFVTNGLRIAEDFSKNPNMTAVLGHWDAQVTLPAAAIYENQNMVIMTPIDSNIYLTKKGYKYTFQQIVNDAEMGKQMALYAKNKGYNNVVIYYADSDYGLGLSNSFEDVAIENGVKTVDRLTSYESEESLKRLITKWSAMDFDSIFIADCTSETIDFIGKLIDMGVKVPIFTDIGLDTDALIKTLGNKAEGIVVATIYHEDYAEPNTKEFIKLFKTKYNTTPDTWAIQGYDSINMLFYAMKKADSANPEKLQVQLHELKDWQGMIGKLSFNEFGEIQGMKIIRKIVKSGKFELLKEN